MLLAASKWAAGGGSLGMFTAFLPALTHGLRTHTATQPAALESIRRFAGKTKEPQPGSQWHWMVSQGHKVRMQLHC
jgi:hypothetical protein